MIAHNPNLVFWNRVYLCFSRYQDPQFYPMHKVMQFGCQSSASDAHSWPALGCVQPASLPREVNTPSKATFEGENMCRAKDCLMSS